MASTRPRYGDHYIILTPCPDFVALNMSADPEYAKLLQMEKNRELKFDDSRVIPRACLKQQPDMLVESFYDEESNMTLNRFKEEVIEAKADSKGRIWVEKGKEALVRRILRHLRNLKMEVTLDEAGLMLPEETEEGKLERNKGGRPPGKNPITDVGR